MQDFRNIKAWEKAHELALEIYKVSKSFPPEELYLLTKQVRSSSSSVSTNIAEGCGKNSLAELIRFCDISMGSVTECEYQILLSKDLGYIDFKTYKLLQEKAVTVRKMLYKFIGSLKKSPHAYRKY